ncbi:MAG TPA: hypothetical protein VK604_11140 [Bryobacteraceae bacterium]|nr:hypothetical protein [Bryobacteraceae bacterium]
MYRQISLIARLPTSSTSRFDQCQSLWLSGANSIALSQLLSRVDLQLLNIPLHRLTQIGSQVVGVGGLNGGRRALSSSLGIQAGPIAGDHFHFWMQTEPLSKAIGGSHWEQVNHPRAFQVH